MQEKCRIYKLNYFNICTLFVKLNSVLIIVCLTVSCNQNQTKQVFTHTRPEIRSESAININTATVEELEKLPNIGRKTAQKIIEHREKFGRFRKPEHLLLVGGFSDRRFREIRDLIKTD